MLKSPQTLRTPIARFIRNGAMSLNYELVFVACDLLLSLQKFGCDVVGVANEEQNLKVTVAVAFEKFITAGRAGRWNFAHLRNL